MLKLCFNKSLCLIESLNTNGGVCLCLRIASHLFILKFDLVSAGSCFKLGHCNLIWFSDWFENSLYYTTLCCILLPLKIQRQFLLIASLDSLYLIEVVGLLHSFLFSAWTQNAPWQSYVWVLLLIIHSILISPFELDDNLVEWC